MCNESTATGAGWAFPVLTEYMGRPNTPPYDLTQRFYGNVMYVPSNNRIYSFPANNYATTVPFTYVNPSIGDYQLLTTQLDSTHQMVNSVG